MGLQHSHVLVSLLSIIIIIIFECLIITCLVSESLKNPFELDFGSPFIGHIAISYIIGKVTVQTLENPSFQEFLNNPDERFDLVIVQQFMNDALKALGHHFDAPVVAFSTSATNCWVNGLVGNPSSIAYEPFLLTDYGPNMSFWQRVNNGLLAVLEYLNRRLIFYPQMNKLIQVHFPGAPPVEVLNHNVSLVLVNSHVSTSNPIPLVPNIIDVGGFHVEPPKQLPKDLKDFLDSASDGAVYFSLGSNLKSEQMDPEKREAFVKVFSELKQKVLWKWENESLVGQSANVKVGKWLPQQDILGMYRVGH